MAMQEHIVRHNIINILLVGAAAAATLMQQGGAYQHCCQTCAQ